MIGQSPRIGSNTKCIFYIFYQRINNRNMRDLTAAGQNEHHDDGSAAFGVNISYEVMYNSFIFLTVIWLAGQIASSRYLKMPSLVGEIIAGILLGPPVAGFVPDPEAWLLLGQIGLILLVLEAGIDIDIATLKLTGVRGLIIASVGSILPIGIGIVIAIAINGTDDMKSVIATGATFGSSSLGIALNTLKTAGILNSPVGQLIISAAVLDDMIALIVLSVLDSLTGELHVANLIIPIVSAISFLVIGGSVALFVIPRLIKAYVIPHFEVESHGKVKLGLMFGLLLLMMPATYYAKASYLMGAFLSGLSFCQSIELRDIFTCQFKRILSWLMRIFFAASIGFQVPITDFGNSTVLWQGFAFSLALTGKLIVGFLVPNFTKSPDFKGAHLRDILITGFTMAAEGEFAFVIAVFSVDNGLTSKDVYASVVLAVLISAIVPPFGLRYVLGSEWGEEEEEMNRKELNEKEDIEQAPPSKILKKEIWEESGGDIQVEILRAPTFDSELSLEELEKRAMDTAGQSTTTLNTQDEEV
jgi:Kef-type K+ transport system membrane component KefB